MIQPIESHIGRENVCLCMAVKDGDEPLKKLAMLHKSHWTEVQKLMDACVQDPKAVAAKSIQKTKEPFARELRHIFT